MSGGGIMSPPFCLIKMALPAEFPGQFFKVFINQPIFVSWLKKANYFTIGMVFWGAPSKKVVSMKFLIIFHFLSFTALKIDKYVFIWLILFKN